MVVYRLDPLQEKETYTDTNNNIHIDHYKRALIKLLHS
jgi:hypothetical protein